MGGIIVRAATAALGRIPPGLVPQFLAWISRAAGTAMGSIDAVVAWTKTNPVSAALVLEGLVQVGMEAKQVIRDLRGNEPEVKDLRDSLAKIDPHDIASGPSGVDRLLELREAADLLKRIFGSLQTAARVRDALTLSDEDLDTASALFGNQRG